MVCLGFEPRVAGWKAQTNWLIYNGTPWLSCFNLRWCNKNFTYNLHSLDKLGNENYPTFSICFGFKPGTNIINTIFWIHWWTQTRWRYLIWTTQLISLYHNKLSPFDKALAMEHCILGKLDARMTTLDNFQRSSIYNTLQKKTLDLFLKMAFFHL